MSALNTLPVTPVSEDRWRRRSTLVRIDNVATGSALQCSGATVDEISGVPTSGGKTRHLVIAGTKLNDLSGGWHVDNHRLSISASDQDLVAASASKLGPESSREPAAQPGLLGKFWEI